MSTYPFVSAKYFTSGGMTEARAILWHMAEGYGTVSWLTHPSNNNSAHFVIDRYGKITQMVRLADASHSAHVDIDPDDADANDCGIYSENVAQAVLGSGWGNLNRYVVSIEVEGYRADGPNTAQQPSIIELHDYLHRQLDTLNGNLGHRDVQDYKSCPGCRFPWATIGGHGIPLVIPPTQEFPVYKTTILERVIGTVAFKDDGLAHAAVDLYTGKFTFLPANAPKDTYAKIRITPRIPGGLDTADRETGYLVGADGAIMLASDVNVSVTPLYTQAQLVQAQTLAVAGAIAADQAADVKAADELVAIASRLRA